MWRQLKRQVVPGRPKLVATSPQAGERAAKASRGHDRYGDVAMGVVATLVVSVLAACRAEPDRVFCEPGLPCPGASEARCAHGPEAERHGRAHFSGSTCVARDDASCRAASLTCALWGQCHAPPPVAAATASNARCAAPDDRDFVASREPACTIDTCVALADDCKNARVCGLEGRCTARDGVCVADAESCRRAELCKTLGWCALDGTQCRAGSVSDCQRSQTCADFGNCAFYKGKCDSCSRSPECRSEGRCRAVRGACAR